MNFLNNEIEMEQSTPIKEQLKNARQAANITQREAAEAIVKPLRTYQRYEEGKHEPDEATLLKLSKLFKVKFEIWAGKP